MSNNYPLFDTAGLRSVMSDLGNAWALTYRLPPGYYGSNYRHREADMLRPQHAIPAAMKRSLMALSGH